nr:BTB/POZ and MATH domain-containing protein 1-like [Aegilops tauschii subsp. strangulata]
MSIYSSTLLDFFSRNFLTKPSPEATAPKPSSYDVIHAGEHTLKVAVHSMLKEGDTMLTSGPFSVGGHDWAIAYFPNGDSRIVDGQFTSVFLKLLSASEDEVTATYTFSLQDPAWSVTGEKNKRGPATAKFSSNQLGWGTPKFVSKAALTASGCLKDDCLVIKCTVKIRCRVPPSDLHSLLDSELKPDKTVKIGWFKRFKVHGRVLASQSPVFRALVESKRNCIRVDDMDVNVFEVLLHYVYNETLPDFMEETTEHALNMARHLLVAADRYEIGRLKLICESKLSKAIDVNTVGLTLDLAEKHSCQQLKACCLKYMLRDHLS